MPTRRPTGASTPALRIGSPAELLQAVPYLLGFHPRESLVVVGLRRGVLVVTMRIDLAELASADARPLLDDALAALCRGGASEFIAAIYDGARALAPLEGTPLEWVQTVLEAPGPAGDCVLLDLLLVSAGRWRSAGCASPECCPPEGRPLLTSPTPFAAAATYAGMVALPDRATLAASLDPLPAGTRAALRPLIAEQTREVALAARSGHTATHDRAVTRALLAAARASDAADRPTADPRSSDGQPDPATAARFGVALMRLAVRDPIWLAVDDGIVDGRELWRELARRLPSPYDAQPLFLFGWRSWREGNGALANIAADRALASDPDCTACGLLLAALRQGVDPRRLPPLRQPLPRGGSGRPAEVRPTHNATACGGTGVGSSEAPLS
jgi:hypothetical protein